MPFILTLLIIDSLVKHSAGIAFGQGKKYTYLIYTVKCLKHLRSHKDTYNYITLKNGVSQLHTIIIF